MNFCSNCGSPLDYRIPEGDNLPRYLCPACHTVHYQNPKVVVGCIPEWDDHILLCRRAIEPRRGYWTLPAGFLENNETTAQGAVRETLEEADANVELLGLFSLINVAYINQVHVFYRSRLTDGRFSAGLETLETALFREDSIVWDQLAFPTVYHTLRYFFADRRSGHYGFHTEDLTQSAWQSLAREIRVPATADAQRCGHS